jgi:hypothetical protein
MNGREGMVDLTKLRDNLREVSESSRHDDGTAQLWFHVGALTAIVDAVLTELIERDGDA